MKMLGKITDCESLELFQANFYDRLSVSKLTNLQCSGCNIAIKRIHHRSFLEYVPKTRERVFFLRKKAMMDQCINKVVVP